MSNRKFRISLMVLSLICLFSVSASAQFGALKKLIKGEETSPKKIAYYNLRGPLAETPVTMPPLFGGEPPTSLKSLLESFKEARRDNDVVAVVIDLQRATMGFAQLQEVHHAISQFRAVDKEVYVHADTLSTLTYALATAASHISMVPTGDLWLTGLYGETPYLRGALDMIGCKADFEHCGDYKTAAETLTRTEPSEQSRIMTKWLLDDIYGSLVNLIAEARDMKPKQVRDLIDGGPYSADDAKKHGLIDAISYREDYVAGLKQQYGEDVIIVADYGKSDEFDIPDDPFAAFSYMFQKMNQLFNPTPKTYTEPSIAVIYVDGAIQTGAAETSPFGSSSGAFSETIRKALDKAADDPSVKAVVLRVDSPGGSALASEIIWNATQRVAANKPLIASMGNVAASGGYYVSCGAETIFADAGTITASIGVVGGKIVTTGLWDKLGINWQVNKRGRMAGIMSSAAEFSDEERTKIVGYMNNIYDIFKGRVVNGRGDRLTKDIDEMAGGRVYSGSQALELGLVDKIGGFQDAIRFAARRAGITDYEIRVIPEPLNVFDALFGGGKGDDEFTSVPRRSVTSLFDQATYGEAMKMLAKIDPLRAGAVLRAMKRIELIHQEGVVTMMPAEILIR